MLPPVLLIHCLAPIPEVLESLHQILLQAIKHPFTTFASYYQRRRRFTTLSYGTRKIKGQATVSSPILPDEPWKVISQEKNSSSNPVPESPSLSRSASQMNKSGATECVPKWPNTGNRSKQVFESEHAHPTPDVGGQVCNTQPARHENPKLRLARLRREAESRSGSSANSLDSASGALSDARARSGASTPSSVSPPRSELGESGRAEGNARMAPKARQDIFDLMGGVHCANLARTGLPRWGHEEVQRLRSEKLAAAKLGKEKKMDTAARGARRGVGVEE